jgi:hypothetical protein
VVWAFCSQEGNHCRNALGCGGSCGEGFNRPDLGGGVIKQRIARTGEGKSKGYRNIVLYQKGEKAFFVYGFAKSETDNIRRDEEQQFKKAAKQVLALSDDQIDELIENGQFEEVKGDG